MKTEKIESLIELAKKKLDEAKRMSKKDAILTLNRAGILTKSGAFTKNYKPLESLMDK